MNLQPATYGFTLRHRVGPLMSDVERRSKDSRRAPRQRFLSRSAPEWNYSRSSGRRVEGGDGREGGRETPRQLHASSELMEGTENLEENLSCLALLCGIQRVLHGNGLKEIADILKWSRKPIEQNRAPSRWAEERNQTTVATSDKRLKFPVTTSELLGGPDH
ncbi:hypothetical protein EYF80_048195 [Liparis tanakae]|uniref:Uncharacterized protein n=1 Tax=Liparis tanakae TaxID=230148 RepID=A0A4Z2FL57_9TELE|nr:hypothetical protein EYF80_048195 [Liparis tanakae]